jgi:hypothetical protein
VEDLLGWCLGRRLPESGLRDADYSHTGVPMEIHDIHLYLGTWNQFPPWYFQCFLLTLFKCWDTFPTNPTIHTINGDFSLHTHITSSSVLQYSILNKIIIRTIFIIYVLNINTGEISNAFLSYSIYYKNWKHILTFVGHTWK